MSLNKTSQTAYDINDECVTVFLNGSVRSIQSDAHNYHNIVQAVLADDWDTVRDLIDLKHNIGRLSDGKVVLEGNTITYKGEVIENAAVSKLFHLLSMGLQDAKPWLRFIDKLMSNPSMNSRNQLYKFLEHKNMPLTKILENKPDDTEAQRKFKEASGGNVIGYKGVGEDYYSINAGNRADILEGIVDDRGRIRNQIGDRIRMKRDMVDDNLNNGCSAGLHIGSHDYADSWGGSGGHLMVIEFSPEHAVSVPSCSSYAKLRVCEYTVVDESTDRRKLPDGLYGADMYHRDDAIIAYLYKKWGKGKRPLFHKMQNKFQGLTFDELQDTLDVHNCSDGGPHWDDELGEYVVLRSGSRNTSGLEDPDDDIG